TGTRYANVLPIPVPASIATCAPRSTASATISAILACASRYVKPGSCRARRPVGPKRCASSSIARLYPEPAGRRPGESVFPAANRGPSSRAATVSKGSAAPVRSVREIAKSSFFQARSYSNGQYRAAHAAAARYTCVTRTPHLAIRINDDKTEIARRLDRRGGGAYTTGQNSLVRRLRAGIPRPD